MIRLVLIASAVLLCVSPAFAQDNMDQRMEAARQTMALTGAETLSTDMMDAMMPTIVPALRQQYPDATEQQLESAMAVISEAMLSTGPEIIEASARAYAARFTLEELEEINAFYETETGAKMMSVMPELMQEGMQAGQRIAVQTMTRIQPQVDAIMAE